MRCLSVVLLLVLAAVPQSRRLLAVTPRADSGLTLNRVLSWRVRYGAVLGQPVQAAERSFGAGVSAGSVEAFPASGETAGRSVLLGIKDGRVVSVRVTPRLSESLPVAEVLRRAYRFSFGSGVVPGTTASYFDAELRGARTSLEWIASGSRVDFTSVTFRSATAGKNHGRKTASTRPGSARSSRQPPASPR